MLAGYARGNSTTGRNELFRTELEVEVEVRFSAVRSRIDDLPLGEDAQKSGREVSVSLQFEFFLQLAQDELAQCLKVADLLRVEPRGAKYPPLLVDHGRGRSQWRCMVSLALQVVGGDVRHEVPRLVGSAGGEWRDRERGRHLDAHGQNAGIRPTVQALREFIVTQVVEMQIAPPIPAKHVRGSEFGRLVDALKAWLVGLGVLQFARGGVVGDPEPFVGQELLQAMVALRLGLPIEPFCAAPEVAQANRAIGLHATAGVHLIGHSEVALAILVAVITRGVGPCRVAGRGLVGHGGKRMLKLAGGVVVPQADGGVPQLMGKGARRFGGTIVVHDGCQRLAARRSRDGKHRPRRIERPTVMTPTAGSFAFVEGTAAPHRHLADAC